MSSADKGGQTIDGSAELGYALGAFFGMILFNVALVAVALIFRKVYASKKNPSNSVELQNGNYEKRESKDRDAEKGVVSQEDSRQPANRIVHDNATFVDVDLSEGVYETPEPGQSTNSNYTALSDVKPEIAVDQPSYTNVESKANKTESEVCY